MAAAATAVKAYAPQAGPPDAAATMRSPQPASDRATTIPQPVAALSRWPAMVSPGSPAARSPGGDPTPAGAPASTLLAIKPCLLSPPAGTAHGEPGREGAARRITPCAVRPGVPGAFELRCEP